LIVFDVTLASLDVVSFTPLFLVTQRRTISEINALTFWGKGFPFDSPLPFLFGRASGAKGDANDIKGLSCILVYKGKSLEYLWPFFSAIWGKGKGRHFSSISCSSHKKFTPTI
jgi:hypothetical protein